MPKFKVSYTSVDWGEIQKLVVHRDGVVVAAVTTDAYCPEDNTVNRLELPAIVADILKATGVPDRDIEYVERELSDEQWREEEF